MDFSYGTRIQESAENYTAAQMASRHIHKKFGGLYKTLTCAWDHPTEGVFTLILSDSSSGQTVTRSFNKAEIKSAEFVVGEFFMVVGQAV